MKLYSSSIYICTYVILVYAYRVNYGGTSRKYWSLAPIHVFGSSVSLFIDVKPKTPTLLYLI